MGVSGVLRWTQCKCDSVGLRMNVHLFFIVTFSGQFV